MLEKLVAFFRRPAWTRFGRITELLIIDLLLGVVAMLTLFVFGVVAEWLNINSKEILSGK